MSVQIPSPDVNRLDWLEWRRNGIGGSDAPVVMNASPWLTPFELWAQKTGRIFPQAANWQMRRGLELEPIAREAYERETGIKMPARRLEHAKKPFIRASFDGLNERAGRVLEIKCPGKADHLEARCGRIPKKYLWQCVHLLLVSGFEYLDYYSFDGEKGILVTMKRDKTLERKLVLAETKFWNYITEDVPPPDKAKRIDGIFRVKRV